jgi:hypothetical protein
MARRIAFRASLERFVRSLAKVASFKEVSKFAFPDLLISDWLVVMAACWC